MSSYYDNAAPSALTYGNRSDRRPAREPRSPVDTSGMSPEELFNYRKGYRLNFGKYKGMSLNEVASIEENGVQVGLTYLYWLSSRKGEQWPPLVAALATFIGHPQVQCDMKAAVAAEAAARPKGRY